MGKKYRDAEGVWEMQLDNCMILDADDQRDASLAASVVKRIGRAINEHFIDDGSTKACYFLARIAKAIEAYENATGTLDGWEYDDDLEHIDECLGIGLIRVGDTFEQQLVQLDQTVNKLRSDAGMPPATNSKPPRKAAPKGKAVAK